MVTREGKEINLDFESHKNQLEGESLEEFEDLEERLGRDDEDEILRQMGFIFSSHNISYDIALEYYSEAEKINSNNPILKCCEGIVFTKKGDNNSAEECAKEAANLSPGLEVPYRLLVSIYSDRRQYDNSNQVLRDAKRNGLMKGFPVISMKNFDEDVEKKYKNVYDIIGEGGSLEQVQKELDYLEILLLLDYKEKKIHEGIKRIFRLMGDENNEAAMDNLDIDKLKRNDVPLEEASHYDKGFNTDDIIPLVKQGCPSEIALEYNNWDSEGNGSVSDGFNGEEIATLYRLGITPDVVKEKKDKNWIFNYIFTFLNLSEKEDFDFVSTGNYGVILKSKDFACKISQEPSNEMNLLRRVRDSNTGLENVIEIKDDVMVENNHMIRFVLEHINGETLESKVINNGPIFSGDVIRYARDISNGLREMRKGRVWHHRDIRPKNIMLDEDNDKGVIIDLGLASTDRYALPKGNRRFGGKNDLVSLGQLMYYLVTGEHIFDKSDSYLEIGEDVAEQIKFHRNEVYDDLQLLQKYLKKVYANLEDNRLKDLVVDCLTGRGYQLGRLKRKFDHYLNNENVDIGNLKDKIRNVSLEEREFKIKRSTEKSDTINIDKILDEVERERRSILTKRLFVEGMSHSSNFVRTGTASALDRLSYLDSQMYKQLYMWAINDEVYLVRNGAACTLDNSKISEDDFKHLFSKSMEKNDPDVKLGMNHTIKKFVKRDYPTFVNGYRALMQEGGDIFKMIAATTLYDVAEHRPQDYETFFRENFSRDCSEEVKRATSHTLLKLIESDRERYMRLYEEFLNSKEKKVRENIASTIFGLANVDLDKYLELYEKGIQSKDDSIMFGTAETLNSLAKIDENKFLELFERGINSGEESIRISTAGCLSNVSRISPEKYVHYVEKLLGEGNEKIKQKVLASIEPLAYIDEDKFVELFDSYVHRPIRTDVRESLGALAEVNPERFIKIYDRNINHAPESIMGHTQKSDIAGCLYKLASVNPNEYLRLYREGLNFNSYFVVGLSTSIKGLADSVFEENIVPLEDDEYKFMVEYLNSDYVRRGKGYKPHEEIMGELKMLAHERVRDYGRLTAVLREGQAEDLEEIVELGQIEHSDILPVKKLREREYLTNEGRVIELVDVLNAQEEGYLVECDYEPFYAFEKEVSRDE